MDFKAMIVPIQAVILAGGLGTRLGDKTRFLPKPMMNIAGRPFLDFLINNLKRQGIQEIVLSIGYLSEAIRGYVGDGDRYGIPVKYAVENEPLGTGGAVRNCGNHLRDHFFVINGDTLFDLNYAALANYADFTTVALRRVEDASRYGSVTLEKTKVIRFQEKGRSGEGLISGGVLWMKRDDLSVLPEGRSSLESNLLPTLAKEGRLAGFEANGYFVDIGIPDSLEKAQEEIPAWERKPVAFLDRDGVLNRDSGYVHTRDKFIWIKGAKEAVRFLNEKGFYVALATNQAGIAHGYYTETDFHSLTEWIKRELWDSGAHLDAVYHCPYHIDGIVSKYRRESRDRKPEPGMLLTGLRDFPSVRKGSLMIGDTERDAKAAEAAGIRFLHFQGGNLEKFVRNWT